MAKRQTEPTDHKNFTFKTAVQSSVPRLKHKSSDATKHRGEKVSFQGGFEHLAHFPHWEISLLSPFGHI